MAVLFGFCAIETAEIAKPREQTDSWWSLKKGRISA
jgi:hypothetical protein